jgi:hypothetical protein
MSAIPRLALISECIELAELRAETSSASPSAPTATLSSMVGTESVEGAGERVSSVLIALCFLGGSANAERQAAESSPASTAFIIAGLIIVRLLLKVAHLSLDLDPKGRRNSDGRR